MFQSTNHADNNSVPSSQYMKKNICIYTAWFLVELYLEFLKFEPKLQTHFIFAHLVRKASYLSLSVFFPTMLLFMLLHMISAEFWSPHGVEYHFEIDNYFLVWGKQIDE